MKSLILKIFAITVLLSLIGYGICIITASAFGNVNTFISSNNNFTYLKAINVNNRTLITFDINSYLKNLNFDTVKNVINNNATKYFEQMTNYFNNVKNSEVNVVRKVIQITMAVLTNIIGLMWNTLILILSVIINIVQILMSIIGINYTKLEILNTLAKISSSILPFFDFGKLSLFHVTVPIITPLRPI